MIIHRWPKSYTQLLWPEQINEALAAGRHVFVITKSSLLPGQGESESIHRLVNNSLEWVILSSGQKFDNRHGCFFFVDDADPGKPIQTSLF